MLKSSFCDYSDAYIPGKGSITVSKQYLKIMHRLLTA